MLSCVPLKNAIRKFRSIKLNMLVHLRKSVWPLMIIGIVFYMVWTIRVSEMYSTLSRRLKPTKMTPQVFHTVDIVNNELPHVEIEIEGGGVCRVNYTDLRIFEDDSEIPIIYFVTPTNPRSRQFAELTRLANTLLHVRNLHWIVADDREDCNKHLEEFLNRIGIPYTYISSPMPEVYRQVKQWPPRGVSNRLASIKWLQKYGKKPGVMYLGDDDNTYDLRLFDEIRYTKRVSMFPVGFASWFSISSPVVRNGKLVGFFDKYIADRKWAVDMAGFAVNLEFMEKSPGATMPYKSGREENEFLISLGLKHQDVELKANNCTEVLAWHSKTQGGETAYIRIDEEIVNSKNTNLNALLRSLDGMDVVHVDDSGSSVTIGRNGQEIVITKDNFDSLLTDYLHG